MSFGTVSDPGALQPVCTPSSPPFLELRPASRALTCINVGAFTVYGLLEVHIELKVDNRSTSLAMFQHLVEPDAQKRSCLSPSMCQMMLTITKPRRHHHCCLGVDRAKKSDGRCRRDVRFPC